MGLNHIFLRPAFLRPVVGAVVAALLVTALGPAVPIEVGGPVKVHATEITHAVDNVQDFTVPDGTTHIAIHWTGHHDATVFAALSADGTTFSERAEVEHDDLGAARGDGETYGALITCSARSRRPGDRGSTSRKGHGRCLGRGRRIGTARAAGQPGAGCEQHPLGYSARGMGCRRDDPFRPVRRGTLAQRVLPPPEAHRPPHRWFQRGSEPGCHSARDLLLPRGDTGLG